jgi:hypothetical protein
VHEYEPHVRWDGDAPGEVLRISSDLDRSHGHHFIARGTRPGDTLLVASAYGLGTVTPLVRGRELVEDVGTIRLERVAGVSFEVYDREREVGFEELSFTETGGGVPERTTTRKGPWRYPPDDFWANRRSGRYELTVKGYGLAGTVTGELVVLPDKLQPLVRVQLEPEPAR